LENIFCCQKCDEVLSQRHGWVDRRHISKPRCIGMEAHLDVGTLGWRHIGTATQRDGGTVGQRHHKILPLKTINYDVNRKKTTAKKYKF